MPAKFVKSIGRTLDARPDRLDLRDREFTPNVSLPAAAMAGRCDDHASSCRATAKPGWCSIRATKAHAPGSAWRAW